MDYLDFDVELAPLGGRDYRVTVRSPAGEADAIMRFPFGKIALENHLLKLQNALLRSGGERRRALTSEEQEVQTFGRKLFETLLAGEVRSQYDQSRASADQQDKGLRLRLHIQAPELAALPWEYLYDQDVGEYICLSRATPIVRYLNLPHARETLPVAPPLRILGMIASPASPATPPLDIETEKARLDNALKPLRARKLVELVWLEGQTWRDLQQMMWSGPWHIFHFTGHGGFNEQAEEGMLALANDEGGLHLLSATHLGRVLADHRALRLVVLSACEGAKAGKRDLFSSVGATLARRGIPAVLAMQETITDKAAIELTGTFYEALAHGLPVDAAVTEARIAINVGINNSLEWGTPVLYMRVSDGTLFSLNRPSPPDAQQAPPEQDLSPPAKTGGQWLEEGKTLKAAMRLEQALEAFEQARTLDPNNADTSYNEGWTLNELKRYEEALTALERAIQLNPHNSDAYRSRAYALVSLQRYEEALEATEGAIQLDPNAAKAYITRSSAFNNLQRYEEALEAAESAIQLDPNDSRAYTNKGSAHSNLQHYKEALESYNRAIEVNPNDANPWYGKGIALENLKQHQEALDAYDQAIQLDSNFALAWYGKGNVHYNLKDYKEALESYDQAIQLDPSYAPGYGSKSLALRQLGRKAEAEQALKKAEELGYKG